MTYPTTTFAKALDRLVYRSGREGMGPPSSSYEDMKQVLDLSLRRCWEYTTWDFLRVLDVAVLDAMVVEGAGTAAANLIFLRDGNSGGKPAYTSVTVPDGGGLLTYNGEQLLYNGEPLTFNSAAGNQILWDTSWEIMGGLYSAAADVATPDLVPSWSVGTGDAPAPKVRRARWSDVGYDLSDGRIVIEVLAGDPRVLSQPQPLRTWMVAGGRLELEGGAPETVYVSYVPPVPDWLAADPDPVPRVFEQAAVNLAYRMFLQGANAGDMEKANSVGADAIPELDDLCLRFARMQTQGRVQVRRAIPPGGRWGGRN